MYVCNPEREVKVSQLGWSPLSGPAAHEVGEPIADFRHYQLGYLLSRHLSSSPSSSPQPIAYNLTFYQLARQDMHSPSFYPMHWVPVACFDDGDESPVELLLSPSSRGL